MSNIFELDSLDFTIDYDENYHIENEHSICPQLRKVFEVINIHPSENSFSFVRKNEFVYTKLIRGKYILIQLKGSFFLLKDYRERLTSLFNLIALMRWSFHFTRIDYHLDLVDDYKSLHRALLSCPQKPSVVCYWINEVPNYYGIFKSTYAFAVYDKKRLLEKKSKRKYSEAYYEKYPELKNKESIVRLEYRIKGEALCSPCTDKVELGKDITESSVADFYKFVGRRFRVPLRIARILKKYKKEK